VSALVGFSSQSSNDAQKENLEGSDAHKMHTNLVSDFGLEVGIVRSLFYTTSPIGIAQLIKAKESAVDPSL